MEQKVILYREPDEKFCENCGYKMKKDVRYCPNCGVPNAALERGGQYSKKSWLTTLMFGLFPSGIHRFYVGKIGTGIIWTMTFGCFGIGWLYDLMSICTGEFRDAKGKKVDWIDYDNGD